MTNGQSHSSPAYIVAFIIVAMAVFGWYFHSLSERLGVVEEFQRRQVVAAVEAQREWDISVLKSINTIDGRLSHIENRLNLGGIELDSAPKVKH